MSGEAQLWVIVHGHFYQPPREDPWAGLIDHQDSARPWHDWNERINAECYAANTDARTLDRDGRITGIINNYEHISFNFGPTLLSWLERHDPRTYEAILASDAVSAARNGGHGNAIAQVYNHMILPLASERDKITQIRWGLADFASRFGRQAEGVWLAETAINLDTVDALISEGVRFVILSPTQAQEVCLPGGDWVDVSNNSIDTSVPWNIHTRRGSLAVFFYDLEISKAVGFEHLLTNAGHFADRLASAWSESRLGPMVNIATDGESYGHHEPFANMCLAAMIAENAVRPRFRLSNYGQYLEACPPRGEVRLKEGNGGLGTAWSCAHGIGRWMEDCGCGGGGPGGWHQRWRGPLRAAFDLLRDTLWDASMTAVAGMLGDFEAARNDYIHVMRAGEHEAAGTVRGDGSRSAFEDLLARHALRLLTDGEKAQLRAIFEAQRNALYMYTSCGWFFSEISGLEGVQCMRYAARAMDLAAAWLPEDMEEQVLAILETAPSNVSHFGNGRRVWTELVRKHVLDSEKVVNQFVLGHLFAGGPEKGRMLYYSLNLSQIEETRGADGAFLFSGAAALEDGMSWATSHWFWFVRFMPPAGITFWARSSDDARLGGWLREVFRGTPPGELFRRMKEWIPRTLGLGDLKYEQRGLLVEALFRERIEALQQPDAAERLDEILEMAAVFGTQGVPLPEDVRPAIEMLCNSIIRRELVRFSAGDDTCDFATVARIFESARHTGLSINRTAVADIYTRQLVVRYEAFAASPLDEGAWSSLAALLAFANRAGLEYDRRWIENRAWKDLHGIVVPAIDRGRPEDGILVQRYLDAAEQVNLQITHWRQRAAEVFGQEAG